MMRTIKLVVCALLLGIMTSNAQESQNFEFGIKGGLNLSKFRNGSFKNKKGLMAGIFTSYKLSERFAIQSEALYSVQGAKSKNSSGKIKLNYINIVPVLVKFYPIDKLNLQAGPQIGYLLSGKGSGFRKKDYKKLDFGIVLGLGYSISDNLEAGIRYHYGLADISKIGAVKNAVVQFSLALKL